MRIYVILFTIFLLSGCATYWEKKEIQKREQFVNSHPEMSLKIKVAVLNGKPTIGMTKEEFLLVRGIRPTFINNNVGSFGISEQWIYEPQGESYFFENGILTSWQIFN